MHLRIAMPGYVADNIRSIEAQAPCESSILQAQAQRDSSNSNCNWDWAVCERWELCTYHRPQMIVLVHVLWFFIFFLHLFFVCVRCFPIGIFISLVFPRAVGWFVLVFLSPVLLDSDERCNSNQCMERRGACLSLNHDSLPAREDAIAT